MKILNHTSITPFSQQIMPINMQAFEYGQQTELIELGKYFLSISSIQLLFFANWSHRNRLQCFSIIDTLLVPLTCIPAPALLSITPDLGLSDAQAVGLSAAPALGLGSTVFASSTTALVVSLAIRVTMAFVPRWLKLCVAIAVLVAA